MTPELEQAARALLTRLNGFTPNLHTADTVQKVAEALDAYAERVRTAAPRSPQSLIAEQIARQAHIGQTEESTGDDYIHHIERVVALVEAAEGAGGDAGAVAWLHDVLEDTPWLDDDLLNAGVSLSVVEAVVLLTRRAPFDYAAYIAHIKASGNPLARAVKIADLLDHLRPNCPARLRPRYEAALQELLK